MLTRAINKGGHTLTAALHNIHFAVVGFFFHVFVIDKTVFHSMLMSTLGFINMWWHRDHGSSDFWFTSDLTSPSKCVGEPTVSCETRDKIYNRPIQKPMFWFVHSGIPWNKTVQHGRKWMHMCIWNISSVLTGELTHIISQYIKWLTWYT